MQCPETLQRVIRVQEALVRSCVGHGPTDRRDFAKDLHDTVIVVVLRYAKVVPLVVLKRTLFETRKMLRIYDKTNTVVRWLAPMRLSADQDTRLGSSREEGDANVRLGLIRA